MLEFFREYPLLLKICPKLSKMKLLRKKEDFKFDLIWFFIFVWIQNTCISSYSGKNADQTKRITITKSYLSDFPLKAWRVLCWHFVSFFIIFRVYRYQESDLRFKVKFYAWSSTELSNLVVSKRLPKSRKNVKETLRSPTIQRPIIDRLELDHRKRVWSIKASSETFTNIGFGSSCFPASQKVWAVLSLRFYCHLTLYVMWNVNG